MVKIRIMLFVCALALFASFFATAQVVSPYFTDYSHTVFVPKKSELIPLGSVMTDNAKDNIAAGTDKKWTLSPQYATGKPFKLKKDEELVVIGFTRSDPNSSVFDYYIVDYYDEWCFVNMKSCPDNSLIDSKNNQIKEYYESLKDKAISLANQFELQVVEKSQTARNKSEHLRANRQHMIDSLFQIQEDAFIGKYNDWEANLGASAKKAAQYIIIHKAFLGAPNTAAGCDYHLTYTNTSKKDIKYLNWNGTAFNAVNDKVSCEIRHTSSFSGQATGPIKPGMTDECLWETVIYNWSAKSIRLSRIVITYMDGSTVSITGDDIASISKAPLKFMPIVDQNKLKRTITSKIDAEINQLERDGKYIDDPFAARIGIGHYFDEEIEIYEAFLKIIREMKDYKDKYSMDRWDAPENVKKLSIEASFL